MLKSGSLLILFYPVHPATPALPAESDIPGEVGGLMRVTVPRTGTCQRGSASRLELSALVGYLLFPNITIHGFQLEPRDAQSCGSYTGKTSDLPYRFSNHWCRTTDSFECKRLVKSTTGESFGHRSIAKQVVLNQSPLLEEQGNLRIEAKIFPE